MDRTDPSVVLAAFSPLAIVIGPMAALVVAALTAGVLVGRRRRPRPCSAGQGTHGFAGTECRIAFASVRAPGGRREEPRADLPDDRGPGGRRVGRLGRAGELVRAAGVRRPLPLGPLPERRWPRRAGVARCVGHRLRAGCDHDDAAARHPRLAGHLPPPERVGQGGRHGRPHLERAGGARNWDGVAGGGARGLRLPVPADGRADETARRAAGSHHARVERWTAELQRRLLRDNQPRRAPEAGADAAPAAHRRRGGRAAVGGARGALCRRVQPGLRLARGRKGATRDARPRVRGTEPRPAQPALLDDERLRDRLRPQGAGPAPGGTDRLGRRTGGAVDRRHAGRGRRPAQGVRGGARGGRHAPAPPLPRRGGAPAHRPRGHPGARDVSAARRRQRARGEAGSCATAIPAAANAAPKSSATVSGSPSISAPKASAPNGSNNERNDIVTAGSSRSRRGSVTNASAVPTTARYAMDPTADTVQDASPQDSETPDATSSRTPPPHAAHPFSTIASRRAPRRFVDTVPIAAPRGAATQAKAATSAYRLDPSATLSENATTRPPNANTTPRNSRARSCSSRRATEAIRAT